MGRGSNQNHIASASPRRGRPQVWTPARIEHDLRALHRDRETFISKTELERLGRLDLLGAIRRTGGLRAWAERLDIPLKPASRPGGYSLEDARHDTDAAIARFGFMPGTGRLKAAGFVSLASYISNRCGNRRKLLTALGYDDAAIAALTDERKSRRPYRWNDELIEAELRSLLAGFDQWPPDSFFRGVGRVDVLSAARYHGGKARWADRLGLQLPARRRPPKR
jgi:hypothetical protein